MKGHDLDHGILHSWGGLHGPYLQIPQMTAEEPSCEPIQLQCHELAFNKGAGVLDKKKSTATGV